MAGKTKAAAGKGPEAPRLRYEVVHDLVLDLIARQRLQPGDRLPSTTELVRMSGISLISVRHALDMLENAGRITRQQGVGTFVARDRILTEPGRSGGLLQTLSNADGEARLTTEVVSMAIGLPGTAVAKALSIEMGQPVWEITRRRNLGVAPAILERAILPLHLVPAMDEQVLSAGGSMYQFLRERYGLNDDYSEQVLEVARPTAAERDVLGPGARDHVIRIRGVSFTSEGIAFDCWQQTYGAQEFAFYSAGSGNRHLVQPGDMTRWEVQKLAPVSLDTPAK